MSFGLLLGVVVVTVILSAAAGAGLRLLVNWLRGDRVPVRKGPPKDPW